MIKTNGRPVSHPWQPKIGLDKWNWPWASKNYNRLYKEGNFLTISEQLSENFSFQHCTSAYLITVIFYHCSNSLHHQVRAWKRTCERISSAVTRDHSGYGSASERWYTRVLKIRPSFWFGPQVFVAYANKNAVLFFEFQTDNRKIYSWNFVW